MQRKENLFLRIDSEIVAYKKLESLNSASSFLDVKHCKIINTVIILQWLGDLLWGKVRIY